VLVEFALVSGDAKPVRMQAQKKHARVSLAEACRLLTGATRKSSGNKNQRSLKDMFQGGAKSAVAHSGPGSRLNLNLIRTFSVEANLLVVFGVVHRFGSNLHTR
jgi:hypothetical protein